MSPRPLIAFLCLTGLCIPVSVLKAQFTWVGNGANGLVSDILNWGGVAPNGSGSEDLTFGVSLGQTQVMVSHGSAFNNLSFAPGRQAYTFSGTGASPTLVLKGNLAVVAGNNVTFDNTLGLELAAGFGHVIDVAASTTAQVNGVVSGGGHLSKNGAGTLVLTGNNTFKYTGDLNFVNSTAVHNGTLHVKGGAINHGTSGDLFVGENNGDNGTLHVSDGGDVSGHFGVLGQSNGSTGSTTVTGAGSTWTTSSGMGIGHGGTGVLNVLAGATVNTPAHANNADSYLGYAASGNGKVSVSGAGSTWSTAAGVIVGHSGMGDLVISSEGIVSSSAGKIGEASGGIGSVTVHGSASSWNVSGTNVYVGNGGTGTLTLYNEGMINVAGGTGTIHLGHSASGVGILNIGADGTNYLAGGIVNAATITTGNGSGTVRLGTNATPASPYLLTTTGASGGNPVLVTGPTQLQQVSGYNILSDANTYSGGTAITGGTLEAAGNNALGTGSVTVSGAGTLLVKEHFLNSSIQVNAGGRLAGIAGGYENASISANGLLAPGLAATGSSAIGSLNFEDLTLGQNGIFEINIRHNGSSFSHDQAVVQNSATLTINATPANRFTLKVISLDSAYALGNLGGVVAGTTYNWLIFDTNGIYDITSNGSTVTTASFTIDDSLFSTALGAGLFGISQIGTDIYLNFTPVPEPSTYAMMVVGLGLAGWSYRRQRSLRRDN
jgi:T5SS/PEP-CTERM-associated repeat protein/autotransporter-associated beta strand protein